MKEKTNGDGQKPQQQKEEPGIKEKCESKKKQPKKNRGHPTLMKRGWSLGEPTPASSKEKNEKH